MENNDTTPTPSTVKEEEPIFSRRLLIVVALLTTAIAVLLFVLWTQARDDLTQARNDSEQTTDQEVSDQTQSNDSVGNAKNLGRINLDLTYPSAGIPDDMMICALDVKESGAYCAANDGSGSEDFIDAPAGSYLVVAYTGNTTNNIGLAGFYDDYSKLNFDSQADPCQDPNLANPIVINIQADQEIDDIVAGDWYYPSDFINCNI